MQNLATIQEIKKILSIPNAQNIECAEILGWKVVIEKGLYNIGDKCVYIQIDTVVPETEQFKFLESKKYRIKTCKLRGQISQGICFPLSILPDKNYNIGDDVTEILGIKKYEKPIPSAIAGETKGNFPSYLHHTDEDRIQNFPGLIDYIKGKLIYASTKIDGTSATFSNHEEDINVCSRNLSKKESETSVYWQMYHKYKIDEIFKIENSIAIQGEVAGSGIQKNTAGFKEVKLLVFDIYDIKTGKYYDFQELINFCKKYNLETVPILNSNILFNWTLEELLIVAEGNYKGTDTKREGVVIRLMVNEYSEFTNGRVSFKVVNNKYLLKNEE